VHARELFELQVLTQELDGATEKLTEQRRQNMQLKAAHNKAVKALRKERTHTQQLKNARKQLREDLGDRDELTRKLQAKVVLAAGKLNVRQVNQQLNQSIDQMGQENMALHELITNLRADREQQRREINTCRGALELKSDQLGVPDQYLYSTERQWQDSLEFALLAAEWKQTAADHKEEVSSCQSSLEDMQQQQAEKQLRWDANTAELEFKCSATIEVISEQQTIQELQTELAARKQQCGELQIQCGSFRQTQNDLIEQLEEANQASDQIQGELVELKQAHDATQVDNKKLLASEKEALIQVQELYEDIDHFQEINGQLQAQIQTQSY